MPVRDTKTFVFAPMGSIGDGSGGSYDRISERKTLFGLEVARTESGGTIAYAGDSAFAVRLSDHADAYSLADRLDRSKVEGHMVERLAMLVSRDADFVHTETLRGIVAALQAGETAKASSCATSTCTPIKGKSILRNLLLAFLVAGPAAAMAQSASPPAFLRGDPSARDLVPITDTNCNALNKGTLICVRNASHQPIVKITCSGFWGTDDMSIPKGTIRSGEMTIVNFTAGKCNAHIVAFSRDGRQHKWDGYDTSNNVDLLITDED